MKKHIKEVSSAGISASSDTEPDFGNYLAGGKIRKLGAELSGESDAWFSNGGYTQTQFPQADDMWGSEYKDLSVFNLDPGIYRKSAQHKLKVPNAWFNIPSVDEADPLDMPNTLDGDGKINPNEEFDDVNFKVPQYKDFFS